MFLLQAQQQNSLQASIEFRLKFRQHSSSLKNKFCRTSNSSCSGRHQSSP